jgi:hypothetical protein
MNSGVSVKISAPNGGYVRFSAMPAADRVRVSWPCPGLARLPAQQAATETYS